jgi:CheY-like chemotaxis protein
MVTPLVRTSMAHGGGQGPQAVVRQMSCWSANIRFVDDDDAFSYVAAKTLRAAGHQVFLARDHREAWHFLESAQPLDLLIADVVLPGSIGGFALARRARLRRLGLRLLYMSADDFPTEEAAGKVLRKPLSPEVLALEARLALASGGDLRSSMQGGTT